MPVVRLVLPLLMLLAWPAAAHAQADVATVPADLGEVTVGSSSARVYLPVTSTGATALDITAVAFDPVTTEFDVDATDCTSRDVAAPGSCFLGVTFTPAAQGVRTATLSVTGNQTGGPSVIQVRGTGIPTPVGAQGPAGAGSTGATGVAGPRGATGAPGAAGPRGFPGRAIQSTCTTRGRPPRTNCRIIVLPDDVAATAFRVRLLRAGRTVARGSAAREGRVRLRHRRPLRRGRYVLAVTFEVDGRTVKARQAVRLR